MRFFEEEAILKEAKPTVISSTCKRGSSSGKDMHTTLNGGINDKVK